MVWSLAIPEVSSAFYVSTWSGLFQNSFHFAWLVASFVLPSFCFQSRILRGLKASSVIETAKTNREKANTKLATVINKECWVIKTKNFLLKEPHLVCLPGNLMPLLRVKHPGKQRKRKLIWIFSDDCDLEYKFQSS